MANIVITSGTDYIKLEYNDYYTNGETKIKEAYVSKRQIITVDNYDSYVSFVFSWGSLDTSYDGNNGWQIDSVDSSSPSSNSDLSSKLSALM